MPDKYLVTGDHPVTLASGRPVAPGDTLPDDAVLLVETAEEGAEHDQQLVNDGVIVELGDTDTFVLSDATDGEVAAWVSDHNVGEVLALATDQDVARRLLAAEETRDAPRRGVVDGLTAVIDQETN